MYAAITWISSPLSYGFLCYRFPVILPCTWFYNSRRKGFRTFYRWFQDWLPPRTLTLPSTYAKYKTH